MNRRAFMGLRRGPDPVEAVPIEFGEWLPDLPENGNQGAIEALNVLPKAGCYAPFPSFTPKNGLLVPGSVRGAKLLFDQRSATQLYAADASGVYLRVGNVFEKRYSTDFPLYGDFLWQFVQFGKNIVAIHPQIVPQAGDVGGASLFTPLGGTPPIARVGARIGDFLVLGNLDAEADPDGARQPQRIRWSAFNNIDGPWISDPATQADFNDMPSEGGEVVGIIGREFGTVFQERCISRMTYVGLPSVFDIQTVEQDRGALCSGGIIDIGTVAFFIAADGFFVWNGTNATPIGDNKVNEWFFKMLNYGARSRVVGAVDYVSGCVMWAFPSGSTGELTQLIVYSYRENRWSHVNVSLEYLLTGATLDASLDDFTGSLDDLVMSMDFAPITDMLDEYAVSLDESPLSLDDGRYKGGRLWLAAFGPNHTYGLFDGAAMEATLDTGEFGGPTGRRVFVNNARPIVDVGTPSVLVAVAQRDQLLGGPVVFSDYVAQEITGECPVLADARYMRFRARIPAGVAWRHARGVEIWRKATSGNMGGR